jgi:hypothetical protein
MSTMKNLPVSLLALIALSGIGCSAAGDSRSALTFVPEPAFREAFRSAAARLEAATGLLALEDTQGRPIRWGVVDEGPADGGTCKTEMEIVQGLRAPQGITCDQESPWLMQDPEIGELILLHELGHAFNPGTAIMPRHDHPEDGSVMLWAPPHGACLSNIDLEYICDMGACSRFKPECWVD